MGEKIKEIDVVSLTEETGRWPAGTTGTVVMDHGDNVMTVEISNDRGEMLDLLDMPTEKLRLVWSYGRSATSSK